MPCLSSYGLCGKFHALEVPNVSISVRLYINLLVLRCLYRIRKQLVTNLSVCIHLNFCSCIRSPTTGSLE